MHWIQLINFLTSWPEFVQPLLCPDWDIMTRLANSWFQKNKPSRHQVKQVRREKRGWSPAQLLGTQCYPPPLNGQRCRGDCWSQSFMWVEGCWRFIDKCQVPLNAGQCLNLFIQNQLTLIQESTTIHTCQLILGISELITCTILRALRIVRSYIPKL